MATQYNDRNRASELVNPHIAPGSFLLPCIFVLDLFLFFAVSHQRVVEKMQLMVNTKQFPAATLSVQSCMSSKKIKERLNTKSVPGAGPWKGGRREAGCLNGALTSVYWYAEEFSHLIVAAGVTIYIKFLPRWETDTQESNCLLFFWFE